MPLPFEYEELKFGIQKLFYQDHPGPQQHKQNSANLYGSHAAAFLRDH
jgi:hypothetical protein